MYFNAWHVFFGQFYARNQFRRMNVCEWMYFCLVLNDEHCRVITYTKKSENYAQHCKPAQLVLQCICMRETHSYSSGILFTGRMIPCACKCVCVHRMILSADNALKINLMRLVVFLEFQNKHMHYNRKWHVWSMSFSLVLPHWRCVCIVHVWMYVHFYAFISFLCLQKQDQAVRLVSCR